ncbi:MAG: hypothetical protein ACRD0C_11500, partial [Acidimicrobiia bacterium]
VAPAAPAVAPAAPAVAPAAPAAPPPAPLAPRSNRAVGAEQAKSASQKGVDKVEARVSSAEAVAAITGSTSGAANVIDLQEKLHGDESVSERQAVNLGAAAGVSDFVGMFVGVARAVKSFHMAGAGKGDQAEAVLQSGAAVASGASGMGALVDKAAQVKTGKSVDKSKEAAGSLGGISDVMNGISKTFSAIKGIVELVRDANELSNEEKFEKSMEVVISSAEAAKSGVSAAKNFIETFGGGASQQLMTTVPGFGIAIGCADVIVRAWDLIQASIARADMRREKQAFKARLGGRAGKSAKDDAESILADPDAAPEDREAAEEYLYAKSLQYINQKRINRAVLKMVVAMQNIAGDAATIGGASAPVGISLKMSALLTDVGATVFRKFKQWARDKAEARADKGESLGVLAIFNQDKSSQKKLAQYNQMINKTLDMIIDAESPPNEPKMRRCATYLAAMGISVEKLDVLVRKDPTGKKLRDEMLASLMKRE